MTNNFLYLLPIAMALTACGGESMTTELPQQHSFAAKMPIPGHLQPASNETEVEKVHATGVQIYECRAVKDSTTQFEWAFVAPDAVLTNGGGKRVGIHYAGPHWEALDGSKVQGSVLQREDAPDPYAIPWLLLATKSVGPAGTYSKVSSIQRINTVGGKAPATGCTADMLGKLATVAYTADYILFSVKNPA